MILVLASLIHLHRQAVRNEEILKGLSCILLILPENRSVMNVGDCVEKNTEKTNPSFEFKPPSNDKFSETFTNPSMPPPPKVVQDPSEEVPKPVCKQIETRIGPISLKTEYRYVGTTLWIIAEPPECP